MQIEKTLPQTLKKCRYCESDAQVYVKQETNHAGVHGYMGIVKCKGCRNSVFAFELTERGASVMARSYWQKGIFDNG